VLACVSKARQHGRSADTWLQSCSQSQAQCACKTLSSDALFGVHVNQEWTQAERRLYHNVKSDSRRRRHSCCKQGPVRARTLVRSVRTTAWLGGEHERQHKHEGLPADVCDERDTVLRRFKCQRTDARSRHVRGRAAPAVTMAALLAVKTVCRKVTFPVNRIVKDGWPGRPTLAGNVYLRTERRECSHASARQSGMVEVLAHDDSRAVSRRCDAHAMLFRATHCETCTSIQTGHERNQRLCHHATKREPPPPSPVLQARTCACKNTVRSMHTHSMAWRRARASAEAREAGSRRRWRTWRGAAPIHVPARGREVTARSRKRRTGSRDGCTACCEE
jgi:hypothetical protein